jgi:hypothetical protein
MKQNGLLRVTRLNVIPASYAPVLELQKLLWEQRKQDLIDDTLLILEVIHSNSQSIVCA